MLIHQDMFKLTEEMMERRRYRNGIFFTRSVHRLDGSETKIYWQSRSGNMDSYQKETSKVHTKLVGVV